LSSKFVLCNAQKIVFVVITGIVNCEALGKRR